MASRALAVAVTASLLFTSRCAEPPRYVVHDLSALLSEAQILNDTTLLDFGTEASRSSLLAGWSLDETAADGASFVWATGASSSLEFVASAPGPVALVFRAWPFHFETAPRQTVQLRLNGHDLGEVELDPSPKEYRVALSEGSLLSGDNRLELIYAYRRAPSDVVAGAPDDRQLAVGWDWMRFEGVSPTEPPRVSGAGETTALVIPSGARLVYYLDVPRDSVLDVEGVRALGGEEETARGSTRSCVSSPTPPTGASSGSSRGRPGRFARRCRPAAASFDLRLEASSAGVVLRRPTVRAASPGQPPTPTPASPPGRPNIVVVVVDTLRADHLGCYGYTKGTSPHLDAFAEESTLFEDAVAQSSWTRPSVASMMTGLSPRAHLANRREDALPAGVRTLAEVLAELGYETAGFVTNTNVAAAFGLDQGFTTYELLLDADPRLGYARANELVERARKFLEEESRSGPWFLYLHATDPHDPYSFTERSGDGVGTMAFMKSLESGRSRPPTRSGRSSSTSMTKRFVSPTPSWESSSTT